MNFVQSETAIKSTIVRILKVLNQRRSHSLGTEAEDDNRSTQFLQMQKDQFTALEDQFDRYCKI